MMRFSRHPLPTAITLALALRLPLLLLPGPGRDEAAYAYWAWHPQAFYAPLLQFLVRLADVLPLAALWRLRLPSLLGGIAVLVLADLRLRRSGSGLTARWLGLLALATCEWQTYTGAILHPDTLFLCALLLAVFAANGEHLFGFAAGISLAALAKPTGILLLPVALIVVGRISPRRGRLQTGLARLILVATIVALGLRLDLSMLRGMGEFARLDPALPWHWRLDAGAVAVMVMGGPLLLLLATAGLGQRWRVLRSPPAPDVLGGERREDPDRASEAPSRESGRSWKSARREAHHRTSEAQSCESARREAQLSLGLASVLLGAFGLAAVVHGQFKANWILPAAVLLMPLDPPSFVDFRRRGLGRTIAIGSLSIALATSTITVVAHRRSASFIFLENAARRLHLGYSQMAGQREQRVSPTRSWQERLGEYRDLGPFVAKLRRAWVELEGPGEIQWIVSDDYGLSAQVAWYERRRKESGHRSGPSLVIVQDGLYAESARRLASRPDSPLLLLAVQCPIDSLGEHYRRRTRTMILRHPLTGGAIEIAGGRSDVTGGRSDVEVDRSEVTGGRSDVEVDRSDVEVDRSEAAISNRPVSSRPGASGQTRPSTQSVNSP